VSEIESPKVNAKLFVRKKLKGGNGLFKTIMLAMLQTGYYAFFESEAHYLAEWLEAGEGKFTLRVIEPLHLAEVYLEGDKRAKEARANCCIYYRPKTTESGELIHALLMTVEGHMPLEDETFYAVNVLSGKTVNMLGFEIVDSKKAGDEFKTMRADEIFCQM
jgi:hypothetical protein